MEYAFIFSLRSTEGTVGRDVNAADLIIGFSECIFTVHTQPHPTKAPVVTPIIGANGLLCTIIVASQTNQYSKNIAYA